MKHTSIATTKDKNKPSLNLDQNVSNHLPGPVASNVDNNPPLYLAKTLGVDMAGSWTVTRSAENGGDKTYAGEEGKKAMADDFISGALHPGM